MVSGHVSVVSYDTRSGNPSTLCPAHHTLSQSQGEGHLVALR